MQPTTDMSMLSLILQASVPVQLVMLLLVAISIMSWTYIFSKRSAIKQADVQTRRFEDDFWSGGDLAHSHGQDERGQVAFAHADHRRVGCPLAEDESQIGPQRARLAHGVGMGRQPDCGRLARFINDGIQAELLTPGCGGRPHAPGGRKNEAGL